MQKICHGKGCQRVLDIVLPVDGEADPVHKDPFLYKVKGHCPVSPVGEIDGGVVKGAVHAVRDDPAGKPFCKSFKVRDVPVDDQRAVGWQQLGKPAEGGTDIVKVLEEVQMVSVNI